jgi:hypothetical protein
MYVENTYGSTCATYMLIIGVIYWIIAYLNTYYGDLALTKRYRNYESSIVKCTYELDKLYEMHPLQKKTIKNLEASMRKGTLRRNNPEDYANEKDITKAKCELVNLTDQMTHLQDRINNNYMETSKITKIMNDRGMWGLSST